MPNAGGWPWPWSQLACLPCNSRGFGPKPSEKGEGLSGMLAASSSRLHHYLCPRCPPPQGMSKLSCCIRVMGRVGRRVGVAASDVNCQGGRPDAPCPLGLLATDGLEMVQEAAEASLVCREDAAAAPGVWEGWGISPFFRNLDLVALKV